MKIDLKKKQFLNPFLFLIVLGAVYFGQNSTLAFSGICSQLVVRLTHPLQSLKQAPTVVNAKDIKKFSNGLLTHELGVWKLGPSAWLMASAKKHLIIWRHRERDKRDHNSGLEMRPFDPTRSISSQIPSGVNRLGFFYRSFRVALPGKIYWVNDSTAWRQIEKEFGLSGAFTPAETLNFFSGFETFLQPFATQDIYLSASKSEVSTLLSFAAATLIAADQGLYRAGVWEIPSRYASGPNLDDFFRSIGLPKPSLRTVSPLTYLATWPLEIAARNYDTIAFKNRRFVPYLEFISKSRNELGVKDPKSIIINSLPIPPTQTLEYWLSTQSPVVSTYLSGNIESRLLEIEKFKQDPVRMQAFLDELTEILRNRTYSSRPDDGMGDPSSEGPFVYWTQTFDRQVYSMYYFSNRLMRHIFPEENWNSDNRRRLPSSFILKLLEVESQPRRNTVIESPIAKMISSWMFERYFEAHELDELTMRHLDGGSRVFRSLGGVVNIYNENHLMHIDYSPGKPARYPLSSEIEVKLISKYNRDMQILRERPNEPYSQLEFAKLISYLIKTNSHSVVPYFYEDSKNPATPLELQMQLLSALARSPEALAYSDYLDSRLQEVFDFTSLNGRNPEYHAQQAFLDILEILDRDRQKYWIKVYIRYAQSRNFKFSGIGNFFEMLGRFKNQISSDSSLKRDVFEAFRIASSDVVFGSIPDWSRGTFIRAWCQYRDADFTTAFEEAMRKRVSAIFGLENPNNRRVVILSFISYVLEYTGNGRMTWTREDAINFGVIFSKILHEVGKDDPLLVEEAVKTMNFHLEGLIENQLRDLIRKPGIMPFE